MAAERRVLVRTYGCQMNVHDSERMAGLLIADGMVPAPDEAQADVVVFNTCAVREKAEDRVYARAREQAFFQEYLYTFLKCLHKFLNRFSPGSRYIGFPLMNGDKFMNGNPPL